jgi:hypothetical protein
MSAQITLTLSEDLLRRAEILARRVGRPVTDVLTETLDVSLKPLGATGDDSEPISAWTDEAVLALADVKMSATEDERLTDLLGRQKHGPMSPAEESELATLMNIYQDGLMRKAMALHEAVRRGLREPLAS